MKQTTMNRLMSVLLAGSALFAAAGSAQGALVTGKLDPLFGGNSALSGLYVTGTETFTVADACLSLTGFVSATGTCGNTAPAMSFTGATLDFYVGSPSGAFVGPATFIPGNPISPIVGMWFGGGQVLGVQSLVTGQASLVYNQLSYLLDIQFGYTDLVNGAGGIGQVSGTPPQTSFTGIGQLNANSSTTLFVEPAATESNPNPCGIGQLAATCTNSSSAALVTTLTTVPEPGSLALAFGALAAGAFVRLRRSRR